MESDNGAQVMSTLDTADTPCVNMCILYWDVWSSQAKQRFDKGLPGWGFLYAEMLHNLFADHGSIWLSIEEKEGHLLKVSRDEVFGRSNLCQICLSRMSG